MCTPAVESISGSVPYDFSKCTETRFDVCGTPTSNLVWLSLCACQQSMSKVVSLPLDGSTFNVTRAHTCAMRSIIYCAQHFPRDSISSANSECHAHHTVNLDDHYCSFFKFHNASKLDERLVPGRATAARATSRDVICLLRMALRLLTLFSSLA